MRLNCEFDFKGMNAFIKQLKGELYDEVKKTMIDFVGDVSSMTKAKTPVDTGSLRESIHDEVICEKEKIVGVVGPKADHCLYVEYGTGSLGDDSVPHTQKETWKYKDSKGNWHTTKGMKAQPYIRPTFEKVKPIFYKKMKDIVSEVSK